jgi:uncharacterized protein DUF1569
MKTLLRERDKTEVLRRLRTVRAGSVARWGRMSAHQMVCHLSDSFRMAIGEKPMSDDSTALRRTIVKWIVLYLPLPWPAGILTRPEIDQEVGGTRPVNFEADVADLEALMAAVTAEKRSFAWRTHPLFGPMSEADWLRWAYLHVDHHLRQFGA